MLLVDILTRISSTRDITCRVVISLPTWLKKLYSQLLTFQMVKAA